MAAVQEGGQKTTDICFPPSPFASQPRKGLGSSSNLSRTARTQVQDGEGGPCRPRYRAPGQCWSHLCHGPRHGQWVSKGEGWRNDQMLMRYYPADGFHYGAEGWANFGQVSQVAMSSDANKLTDALASNREPPRRATFQALFPSQRHLSWPSTATLFTSMDLPLASTS